MQRDTPNGAQDFQVFGSGLGAGMGALGILQVGAPALPLLLDAAQLRRMVQE